VGRIFLRDLEVETVIGVEEHERLSPQPLVVSVELDADLDRAAGTDDLRHAVDYAAVAEVVRTHAKDARFRLLEAFAGSLADAILDRFAPVSQVLLRIEKPRAVRGARAGIELRRARRGA
jgi:dihydroneopterin aldolase